MSTYATNYYEWKMSQARSKGCLNEKGEKSSPFQDQCCLYHDYHHRCHRYDHQHQREVGNDPRSRLTSDLLWLIPCWPTERDLQIFDFFWKWNRPHPERRDKADKHWNVYFWHFEWFGDVSGVDSCFRIICTFKGQDCGFWNVFHFSSRHSTQGWAWALVVMSQQKRLECGSVVRERWTLNIWTFCPWEMNIVVPAGFQKARDDTS